MANLRPQNSQRTESLFAKNHEPFFNGIGPNAKCRDVRFCAVVGVIADVTQTSSEDR
jgi:hypothetical protein